MMPSKPVSRPFLAPATAVPIVILVAGCAVASPYVSQALPGARATVVIQKGRESGLGWTGRVDVYDFNTGCPNFGSLTRANGYNGSLDLEAGKETKFVVAAGGPLALRTRWSSIGLALTESCDTLLTFVPAKDQRYQYEYVAPVKVGDGCRARLYLIETLSDGRDHLAPEPSVRYPRIRMGAFGIEAPELCGAAKPVDDVKDRSGPPTLVP
jgi:hypothetical protein